MPYCSVDELCSRIDFLVSEYPKYGHEFPILCWSCHNDENELIKKLKKIGIDARLKRGPYYDSYAEGDWDLCVEANHLHCDKFIKYSPEISSDDSFKFSYQISGKRCYYPMINGPEEVMGLSEDMDSVPEQQINILKKLYPNSWQNVKFEVVKTTTHLLN